MYSNTEGEEKVDLGIKVTYDTSDDYIIFISMIVETI